MPVAGLVIAVVTGVPVLVLRIVPAAEEPSEEAPAENLCPSSQVAPSAMALRAASLLANGLLPEVQKQAMVLPVKS